jgi:hypothetical protein
MGFFKAIMTRTMRGHPRVVPSPLPRKWQFVCRSLTLDYNFHNPKCPPQFQYNYAQSVHYMTCNYINNMHNVHGPWAFKSFKIEHLEVLSLELWAQGEGGDLVILFPFVRLPLVK